MARFPKWYAVESTKVENNRAVVKFRIRWWHPVTWWKVLVCGVFRGRDE